MVEDPGERSVVGAVVEATMVVEAALGVVDVSHDAMERELEEDGAGIATDTICEGKRRGKGRGSGLAPATAAERGGWEDREDTSPLLTLFGLLDVAAG